MLEPPRDLLGRPQRLELGSHDARQASVPCQFASLGTVPAVPRRLVGLSSPVALSSTVALDLPADSRWRSPELLAIARIEKPATTAREISSRSAKVSAKEDRHRSRS